jgi:hypothetical protein
LQGSRIDATTGLAAAAPIPAIIPDFIDHAVINIEHELRSLTESVARRTDREPNGCAKDKHWDAGSWRGIDHGSPGIYRGFDPDDVFMAKGR